MGHGANWITDWWSYDADASSIIGLQPAVEAWTSSAQPWAPHFEGAAQLDRGPS